jgi:hypothetical protein
MGKNERELRRQYRDLRRAGKDIADTVTDALGVSKRSKSFAWVKERIIRSAKKATVSFPVHFTTFVVINAFLIGLNLTIAGPSYPWFYFALGGWGIGLLADFQHVLNKRRDAAELKKIESMPDKLFKTFRRLQRSIGSFRNHLVTFLSTNAYIFGINMITSPGFFWFLFVLGPWSAGLLAHWVSYTARKRMLKQELKAVGIDMKRIRRAGVSLKDLAMENFNNLYARAVAIKEDILKEIKSDQNLKLQWGELEPTLDKYIEQIKDLTHKSGELDRLLSSTSLMDIEQELAGLKEKQAHTENTVLKNEYERSITQFEKHRKSIVDILNRKEIISVRLSSSIALLNQIKLDTMRMKHAHSISDNYSFKELQQKTDEIQEYLVNFQDEMDKLEQV